MYDTFYMISNILLVSPLNKPGVCFLPESTASSVSNTSVSELHSLPVDSGPKITSTEPALEELTKLSRDLMAIRLQVDKHFQGSKTSQEWQMIGAVIDRLLFGLYVVFIAVSFIIIMCIWLIDDHRAA